MFRVDKAEVNQVALNCSEAHKLLPLSCSKPLEGSSAVRVRLNWKTKTDISLVITPTNGDRDNEGMKEKLFD